jgi:tRNA pseudouridine55 synthase
MEEEAPKILFIDKPKGITSFDVIRRLRRKLGIRKMGHAGTLDPNASGLLLVGVGKGTKELAKLIGLPKTYVAEILLGVKTDTGDTDGKILETKEVPSVAREEIERVLSTLVGIVKLPVPMFSAIKQNGQPLYKKAYKGHTVTPPVKEMKVHRAVLVDVRLPIVTVSFDVGSGTYIRSLAEEFGQRLGTVATVQNLRRTRIGDYGIEDAETLDG